MIVRELISTLKKKAQAENELFNIIPKILALQEKATTTNLVCHITAEHIISVSITTSYNCLTATESAPIKQCQQLEKRKKNQHTQVNQST